MSHDMGSVTDPKSRHIYSFHVMNVIALLSLEKPQFGNGIQCVYICLQSLLTLTVPNGTFKT